jgi:hypothetical protein
MLLIKSNWVEAMILMLEYKIYLSLGFTVNSKRLIKGISMYKIINQSLEL